MMKSTNLDLFPGNLLAHVVLENMRLTQFNILGALISFKMSFSMMPSLYVS